MGFLGALLGAGIGWWLAGPLGVLVGAWLGSSINTGVMSNDDTPFGSDRQAKGGFIASLMVLIAAVIKADGHVRKIELDYVKSKLVALLGVETAQEAVLMLRDILKKDINIQEVSLQIRVNLDYSSRLELMHLLMGIAQADGVISNEEYNIIKIIGFNLGISSGDMNSILNMFGSTKNTVDSAYKVLEIEPTATDDEVKKAYRKLAMRFHPDKVAGLGKEIQESANDKFRKVQEAYEMIKTSRGMK